MTLAVTAPTSSQQTTTQTVPIVVLGTDALLAALPATPVQLAHACLRAGFANVIPASWGDELIAAGVLRRLPSYGAGPAIQCSCPIVAHRLLAAGGDLRHALIPLVSPPVAIARYLRALSKPVRTRITYVGSCPGANDDAIDIRMRPDALLAMLAERGISLDDQPRVFESIIPPDRRRFRSQPGGVPSVEALWNEVGARTLVEIDGEDLVTEVAQHLLTGKNVLIDVSARLGCACSGAVGGSAGHEARNAVIVHEPPRSTTPVVEEQAPIELDLPVPAAPRTPVDVAAISPFTLAATSRPSAALPPLGHRISPVPGVAIVPEPRPSRSSSVVSARPVLGPLPVTRDGEGKSLPRAYIARRRSSPKGIPVVSVPDDSRVVMPASSQAATSTVATAPVSASASIVEPTPLPTPAPTPSTPPSPPVAAAMLPGNLSARQWVYILIAVVMLALSMSAIVGVVVGRLVRTPPAPTAPIDR